MPNAYKGPLSCRAHRSTKDSAEHALCESVRNNAGSVCARVSEPIGRTKHKLNLLLRQLTSSLRTREREREKREERGLITINRKSESALHHYGKAHKSVLNLISATDDAAVKYKLNKTQQWREARKQQRVKLNQIGNSSTKLRTWIYRTNCAPIQIPQSILCCQIRYKSSSIKFCALVLSFNPSSLSLSIINFINSMSIIQFLFFKSDGMSKK